MMFRIFHSIRSHTMDSLLYSFSSTFNNGVVVMWKQMYVYMYCIKNEYVYMYCIQNDVKVVVLMLVMYLKHHRKFQSFSYNNPMHLPGFCQYSRFFEDSFEMTSYHDVIQEPTMGNRCVASFRVNSSKWRDIISNFRKKTHFPGTRFC